MHAQSVFVQEDLSTATDRLLIESSLRGQHSAFAHLIQRYQSRLYASMLRVTHSADLAEEIVQDSFVQAYIKLDTFRSQATFLTWLHSIAFNKFLSLKRAARASTSLESLDDGRQFQTIDQHDSAETLCVRSEEKQKVHDALSRLDRKSRRILVLREINGLSYEEISEILKIKLGTVRSQLSRARCKLLRELSLERSFDDCL